MRSILIWQIFCCYILSVNNRDTGDTQINAPAPIVNPQLFIQLGNTAAPFIVLFYVNTYSILNIHF